MYLKEKKEKELEMQNKILKEMLVNQSTKSSAPKPKKKVLYQCKYCVLKSIRNADEGAPFVGANCPKHPKGWCKGVHSFQRTYLWLLFSANITCIESGSIHSDWAAF